MKAETHAIACGLIKDMREISGEIKELTLCIESVISDDPPSLLAVPYNIAFLRCGDAVRGATVGYLETIIQYLETKKQNIQSEFNEL